MAFNLDEVVRFSDDLVHRLPQDNTDEGLACANLDAMLHDYAKLCCEYRNGVRQWGRDVFSGRITFDPQAEALWKERGTDLYVRSVRLLENSQLAEKPCYVLDGQAVLQSALWQLNRMLSHWVTPRPSVGPAARSHRHLTEADAAAIKRRLDALPVDHGVGTSLL